LIVLVVLVALFGYKKLPDASRSLGRSLRIFKTEIKGMTEDDKARQGGAPADQPAAIDAPPAQPPAETAPPAAQPAPPSSTD
jgi:sec-independent protein translocase protein TatA